MAPVEYQRSYLNRYGVERPGPVFTIVRGQTRTILFKPAEIILGCSRNDKYGTVQLRGDTSLIEGHLLDDQVEEDVAGERLGRPLKIKGNQRLILISRITGYNIEIRHHPSH